MGEVFTLERVNVQQGLDLVQLELATHRIRLHYQTTFAVVRALRVAAKAAMPHEGLVIGTWRELAGAPPDPCTVPMHPTFRQSGRRTNVETWRVGFEGALVLAEFNELVAKFHYPDAFRLQAWLRVAARQAKHWAGDRGRAMAATAYLTDAEFNDRLGLR